MGKPSRRSGTPTFLLIALQLVPTSVHLMFGVIILLLTFLQVESPRHLIRVGKKQEALETMAKLRGMSPTDEYVLAEVSAIQLSFDEEKEATLGMGWKGVLREVFTIKRNAYRLFLTNLAQLMACWSGGSAITVYAPDLFNIVGITGEEQALLSTAIFGVVKLVAAIVCALFLVDTLGRKRALVIGITLQTIAMFYVCQNRWVTGSRKAACDPRGNFETPTLLLPLL